MYNVEKYISQCIESITGQTYNNLEIILIDDGSPDRSGTVADEYSRKDERIKVFHTGNKGVSAARNLGLKRCCGEFVVFVDADDFLAPEYVEYMFEIVKETNSEFVMSRNCFKHPGLEQQVETDKIVVLPSDQAVAELLYPDNIDYGCWNKMFNKDFLQRNKITFPEKFFMGEGLNFIIASAQMAGSVGIGRRKVYYYRKDNKHSATTAVSVDKYINALRALDNIEKTAVLNSKIFKDALKIHRYFTTFAALKTILTAKAENSYRNEYISYLSYLRKNALGIMTARISFLKKIRMWAYCISPNLAHKLFTLLLHRVQG